MRLTIDRVVLRRGNRNVINGASYQVAAGEIVALVGANGCGKSTLLAGVAGVLAPISGQITVDELDVWGKPAAQYAARARFGYVPENADAPGFLTGGELVALAAAARRGMAPTPAIIDALGLGELAPVRIDRMSLGQRR
nr:ABC transporter ATP-binding protein [Kofleriaceae bacterium]